MANLADDIEQFLRHLVKESGMIEVQRATLASHFGCVPSQINYVLTTRFTPERGYVVESRRGGGGYIRVTRLNLDAAASVRDLLHEQIGGRVTQDEALGYIHRLREQEIIDEREAAIMTAALHRDALGLELPIRDVIRANLLKAMILAVLRY